LSEQGDVLAQHAQRRRELLKRAAGGVVTTGPAVALLLEGALVPKRAAAYTVISANCLTLPVFTTALAPTGSGAPVVT